MHTNIKLLALIEKVDYVNYVVQM